MLALQKGLALCMDMDISLIQIKGDCLVPIMTIQNTAHLAWDIMVLWKKTMKMLTAINSQSIQCCKMLACKVADYLAKTEFPVVTMLRLESPSMHPAGGGHPPPSGTSGGIV